MSALYLDVGNSRVKYLKRGNGTELSGHCTIEALSQVAGLFDGVRTAWCSVVGNPVYRETLMGLLETQVTVVHWVNAQMLLPYFTPAYAVPESMGIDRWLAMFAVLDAERTQPVVVADAGTALTIDVLRGNQHLGGYILPGYRTQLASLVGRAALPEPESQQMASTTLGASTSAAMSHGVWLGLSAAVNAVCQSQDGAKLFVTGGDGAQLVPLMTQEAVWNDNLVIAGLIKLSVEKEH